MTDDDVRRGRRRPDREVGAAAASSRKQRTRGMEDMKG
jgi:hypothetical protein